MTSVLNNLCKRAIVETALWQSVLEKYNELILHDAPICNRHCPPFADCFTKINTES